MTTLPATQDQASAVAPPERRAPPVNYEAEQALLAAVLANNRAYDAVCDFLRPEHFADPAHGRIFEACGKLIDRGQIANAVTLKNAFETDAALREVGGAQYLAQLQAAYVTIINAEHYGRAIHDLALRRELIAIGEDIVNDAHDHDLDRSAAEQIEAAATRLCDLGGSGVDGAAPAYATHLDQALDQIEAAHKAEGGIVGVPTGLSDLDRKLGGLRDGHLIVVAGRPGMGKTALARGAARHAAGQGYTCLFCSTEMPGDELAQRDLCAAAGVDGERLRLGRLDDAEFEALVRARRDLASLPLLTNNRARSVPAIRAECRRIQRRHGLGLVVVDYIQLLAEKAENRTQEITRISRELKALAGDLGCPVMVVSQLSRAVEGREDKRPQLADLRESGAIEQDADVVVLLYREHYYLERAQPRQRERESEDQYMERYAAWQARVHQTRNVAEAIVAKNRHGATTAIKLHFDGATTSFSDLAHHHDQDTFWEADHA